ncbi:hypothetical protein TNCT1_62980 [Streptomyces sp. 1-11]|nr:hypothetical protein TNCT1_62980 [Streptomyces sp. 1-11]
MIARSGGPPYQVLRRRRAGRTTRVRRAWCGPGAARGSAAIRLGRRAARVRLGALAPSGPGVYRPWTVTLSGAGAGAGAYPAGRVVKVPRPWVRLRRRVA